MDNEEQKRAIYERLSQRRKKFIDKIGYENWEPFQEPNHPIEIRRDKTSRTAQGLIKDFLATKVHEEYNSSYGRGVYEFCMGLFNADERYRGMFDFVIWYLDELEKRGIKTEEIWKR